MSDTNIRNMLAVTAAAAAAPLVIVGRAFW